MKHYLMHPFQSNIDLLKIQNGKINPTYLIYKSTLKANQTKSLPRSKRHTTLTERSVVQAFNFMQ
jgi:hypothetical protein